MAEFAPEFEWPYHAALPQRFGVNYGRYRARGGTARPSEDVAGFVAGGERGDIARFLAFTLAFDQIAKEGVPGDVAELGVWRGFTAHALATFARRLGRHTYLFDTFAGFDPADFTGVDQSVAAGFADTSLEAVRALVGTERTTYCKGHFPGTTAMVPDDATFSLVHIDCDLYAPMLSALAFFYPRMAPGGFMLIHDYSSLAWEGAERAADLFFADKPECLVPMPDNCGTAVVRRARPVTGETWQDRQAAAIFGPDWVGAGTRALDSLFVEGGWSGAEEWGRWGIGAAHTLSFRPPAGTRGDLVLELDVAAVIGGTQTAQSVEVWVGETQAGRFVFTAAENRGIRRVPIPAAALAARRVAVTFRPQTCLSPRALGAHDSDDRPLGMAVHRVRVS